MPASDGVDGTRAIAAETPESRVVVLTSFADRDRLRAALDAGAVGHVLKDVEPQQLFAVIRTVAARRRPGRNSAPVAARVIGGVALA
jgi:DNA-binding NarL/FixJ family response regulator